MKEDNKNIQDNIVLSSEDIQYALDKNNKPAKVNERLLKAAKRYKTITKIK